MARPDRLETWQRHCPILINDDSPRIKLAHGEGGRLMRSLIRDHILPHFTESGIDIGDDATRLPEIDGRLAITTDSFVVSPLFFPGGDIGKLAVYGTANDLAVNGAKPLFLSLSLILEEGFPIDLLDHILTNVAASAKAQEIKVVTGDTKIVPVGAADGLFINTTGIGLLEPPVPIGAKSIRDDDEIVVTGPIGRHGIAVLCAREDLDLTPPPESDCGSLVQLADVCRNRLGDDLRAMRDATRGGVAAVLHEWAESSGKTLAVQEADLPISPIVRGACELLGLDPLHVANEGTMMIAVAAGCGKEIVEALRTLPEGKGAAVIGKAGKQGSHPVVVQRMLGIEQALDDPLGAPLPRIC